MKDIRLALRSILLSDVDVSTAVGGSRIFPSVLPQGVVDPSVVYNTVTEASDYHMNGPSGLAQDRIQVDCWAQRSDQAVELANLVRDRLSGFSGTVSVGSQSPQDQIIVRGIFHDQGRDDYDALAKLHTRRRDYMVWYADR